MFHAAPLALVAFLAQLATALNPATISGADFITSTGERLQIVGVAYQPGGSSGYNPELKEDPLTDGAICLRDAALMQRLGVNAVRVYNVDPSLNHDLCASIFDTAGIYMIIDVNSPFPNESLSRDKPWESYNDVYLERTFAVIENFKNYPNTLMFFSGNEVINDVQSSFTAPYIRAVTRDIKDYVKTHSDRPIPVGYSAADVREVLVDSWNYFRCSLTGDDSDSSIADVFALNSYSWCGAATFSEAGYDQIVAFFKASNIPVFFSEYGCREIRPRIFDEVGALYGLQMTPYLSGGVVYEYTQEANDFGLVVLNSDGTAALKTDYDNLQSQFNKLDFSALQKEQANGTAESAPKCVAKLISKSGFPTNFTIPATPKIAAGLIKTGIKSPNNGKIITVSNLKVSQTVKASDGTVMTGLEVTPIANGKSNTPSGKTATSSGSSSTAVSAAAASSSSAAAGMMEMSAMGMLATWFFTAVWCL